MSKAPEINDYRKYTAPAELHKAVNTLRGIVAGINTDHEISPDEVNELSYWCMQHYHLIERHPFRELIPLIESAYKDKSISRSEAENILWLCNNFVSDSNYYDLITSSLQFLNGLVHGILADNVITDDEIYALQNWIRANDFLIGCYPFDEIESLLYAILQDGVITEDERNMLKAFLSNFIDVKNSLNLREDELNAFKEKYSVRGVCAICQELDFNNTVFCFTGQSENATRNEIAEIIERLGGIFKDNLNNQTRYLIVGNAGNPCWAYSCYGRKIEDAIKRRKKGQNLTIVNELDFWDIIADME